MFFAEFTCYFTTEKTCKGTAIAKPHEKLAESRAVLKALQDGGRRIFKSDELTRVHQERRLQNGFLRDIIKGWLTSTCPQAQQQDTAPWYTSFWEFCNDRFGKDWFLSPEQSLLLHAEAPTIPPQVVVNSPKGPNNKIDLPFGISLYDLKVKEMPAELIACLICLSPATASPLRVDFRHARRMAYGFRDTHNSARIGIYGMVSG
ncbi:hypothetical protein [Ensifer sp. 22564]|uniref:hypothetical protein n=1 Tax=unclassified Ensifer TaxID=2633371 RepID=UPI003F85FAE2